MTMIQISVITPSIRPRGLQLVKQALSYQDFKNFEWLVCTPQPMEAEVKEVLDDCVYRYIGNPPLKKGMLWDLNYSYNRLIEAAKGELIVSWQDYTFADPDVLSTLWRHYMTDNKRLVSVLGNKYPDEEFDVASWIDPRYETDTPSWMDVEWNLCSCPKKLLTDVGGFDEGADYLYFGMDGFGVNHRLSSMAHFVLEKNTRSYSLFHGRNANWEKNNGLNGPYAKRVKELKNSGKWPVLDYLKRGKVE